MTAALAILIWPILGISQAYTIEKCGEYVVEGFVGRRDLVLVEKGSRAQINIKLEEGFNSPLLNRLSKMVGSNAVMLLRFKSPCLFQCEAELTEIIRQLEPYEKPLSFLETAPQPKVVIPCRNPSNARSN